MTREYEQHFRNSNYSVILWGDSITAHWDANQHRQVWRKTCGQRECPEFFNMGVESDTLATLLHRLQHGVWFPSTAALECAFHRDQSLCEADSNKVSFSRSHVRVMVVLIGTNDASSFSLRCIAQTTEILIQLLQLATPGARILLLALLPRASFEMIMVLGINRLLRRLHDGDRVHFVDRHFHALAAPAISKLANETRLGEIGGNGHIISFFGEPFRRRKSQSDLE
jgi:hypothetical protein